MQERKEDQEKIKKEESEEGAERGSFIVARKEGLGGRVRSDA